MTCQNCTCSCQTPKNLNLNHNQKTKIPYKSKPKGYYSKKTNKHRHCTCDEDIYIPEPYTSNCCDGKRIVGGTQGNVEKADCACAHVNKYY